MAFPLSFSPRAARCGVLFIAVLLAGCGTGMSGRLDGQVYTSRSGDITCTFPPSNPEVSFHDYSTQDGEWVSRNAAGSDLQRVERIVLKQGLVPAFYDVEALVDNVLPRYLDLTERIRGARVVKLKSLPLGSKTGIYTLVEFKIASPQDNPPYALDYRGILWLLGEKYGTSLHVYNWRYGEKDADRIEARLVDFYNGCRLKG
jgi:hypothetical protein